MQNSTYIELIKFQKTYLLHVNQYRLNTDSFKHISCVLNHNHIRRKHFLEASHYERVLVSDSWNKNDNLFFYQSIPDFSQLYVSIY